LHRGLGNELPRPRIGVNLARILWAAEADAEGLVGGEEWGPQG